MTPKTRNRLFNLARILISVALLAWVLSRAGLAQLAAAARAADLRLYLLAVVLAATGIFMRAARWLALLRAVGARVPGRRAVYLYFVGAFFNTFLPTGFGGDVVRVLEIGDGATSAQAAGTALVDRLTGFIALVSLSLVASVFVAQRLDRPGLILLPLGALALLLLVLFLLWQRTWVRALLRLSRLDRFAAVVRITEKFFVTFARYGADRRVVVRVMAISFLFQFLLIFAVYLMALALHAPVHWLYFGAFVPLITLMEAIPVSVYGIGIRDMGYVFFFGMAGMSDVQTRSLALLFLAVTFVYSLIGGLLYLGRVYSAWQAAEQGRA